VRQKLRSKTLSTEEPLTFLRPYTSPGVHQASPLLDIEAFFLDMETVRRKNKYMESWSTDDFGLIDVHFAYKLSEDFVTP
jgi:hypothetical protein